MRAVKVQPLAARIAVVAAALFLGLLVLVSTGALGRGSVDVHADAAANAAVRAHPALLSTAHAVTNLGAPLVVDILAVVAALALWFTGHRRAATYVLAVRIGGQIVASGVKVLVGRPRPVLPHPVAHAVGHSFPSGHATDAASVYLPLAVVVCALFAGRALRVSIVALAMLICLAVATTRVLLGVHYPSDVLAGLAAGVALTAILTPVLDP